MEELCLPVGLVLVSGSHSPQRRFGWGALVVISILVTVLVLYGHGAKRERQNSSLTAQTTQIRVTMPKRNSWGHKSNSCEL